MRYFAIFVWLLTLSACSSVMKPSTDAPVSPEQRAELAPTGTLRVGLNLSTTLLAARDASTGQLKGVAIDIAQELARQTGVPITFVGYATGQLEQRIDAGEWDIAFFAIEPERAKKVSFSPPYAEIATTYLVKERSPMRRAEDVDRDGVVVAVSRGAGYESSLVSALRHAKLLRTNRFSDAIKDLRESRVDVIAGLEPTLVAYARDHSTVRVLEGRFGAVQQAIGIPIGKEAAAAYLRVFMDEIKRTGFVARSIESNKADGLQMMQ